MKVLIIGKNGQLGNELVSVCKKEKFDTYAFSHEELDITDVKSISKKITQISPDITFNASAYHVVSKCEEFPEQAFLINSIALKNLAIEVKKINGLLVTYSTDYVFDGLKGMPYTELDSPNPVQTYGISKVAGEYMAKSYNPNTIIIRSCGVYGGKSGSKSKNGNFVLTILRAAEIKKELEVTVDEIVNPTYAIDLAKASIALAKHKQPGIYHLASEGNCSLFEFAEEIMRLKGKKIKITSIKSSGIDVKNGVKRPLFSAIKNVKAKELGITLPDWKTSLQAYMSYLSND